MILNILLWTLVCVCVCFRMDAVQGHKRSFLTLFILELTTTRGWYNFFCFSSSRRIFGWWPWRTKDKRIIFLLFRLLEFRVGTIKSKRKTKRRQLYFLKISRKTIFKKKTGLIKIKSSVKHNELCCCLKGESAAGELKLRERERETPCFQRDVNPIESCAELPIGRYHDDDG